MATIYARNETTNEWEKVGPAANATDQTLTLKGSPADAKATGDAINNIQTQISQLSSEKVDRTAISLGINADGLIYIYVNGAPVGTGIEQGVSGDVIGYVDSNNNIILTGTLAVGTYSVKYELEDGTTVDIGEMEFTEEEPEVPSGGNLADPTSADWSTDCRLSTSAGTVKTGVANHIVTNFIPAKMGDVLRVKGLDICAYVSSNHSIIGIYKADKTYQNFAITSNAGSSNADCGYNNVTVDGDISTYTILMLNSGTQRATTETAFIRIDGVLMDGYTANDVIITINEEIV